MPVARIDHPDRRMGAGVGVQHRHQLAYCSLDGHHLTVRLDLQQRGGLLRVMRSRCVRLRRRAAGARRVASRRPRRRSAGRVGHARPQRRATRQPRAIEAEGALLHADQPRECGPAGAATVVGRARHEQARRLRAVEERVLRERRHARLVDLRDGRAGPEGARRCREAEQVSQNVGAR